MSCARVEFPLTCPPHGCQTFLSLVIPCYNEQENVDVLLSRVDSALVASGRPFEVILVDDGSTGDTPRLLREGLAKSCGACLTGLRFKTVAIFH